MTVVAADLGHCAAHLAGLFLATAPPKEANKITAKGCQDKPFLTDISHYNRPRNSGHCAATSDCSISAIISSICSMPTDSRTRSELTPARANSSSLSCRWVVLAGWQASDLASPMFTNLLISCRASINFPPATSPQYILPSKLYWRGCYQDT